MSEHEKWMEQAFLEAEKAYSKKEVPVGAVVVFENKIIGRGHNLVEHLQDPTAHAEILAITAASNYLASWRLENTSIYVTLEPCPMCAGAIFLARIENLYYGAGDPRWGACGSKYDLLVDQNVNVVGGILEGKCQSILKAFFSDLRSTK